MTAAQILRTLRAVPFHPFMMHLADGRGITIQHPELLALAGGDRIAEVVNDERLIEWIDVLLIVSLRPLSSEKV